MGYACSKLSAQRAKRHVLPARTTVGAAVFFAVYGMPHPAAAASADTSADALQEITVTANRREQSIEDVPYNISVVSADQLARTGVTDMASLVRQVPGLSMFDFGARYAGATAPIIRGLNATGEPRGFRSFEQDPVGTYIGNSPLDGGYFQLDDVSRVEVLRGPQGTLYGAGALGGALRIMPNAPELGVFSGKIGASGGTVAHSSGESYSTNALVNVPIGDTVAFRISGKYSYDPGFIDQYGLEQRSGSPLYAAPALANPSDPVNSSAIFGSRNDFNYQRTFTGRASLLWKPNDAFNAELAYIYAHVSGDGGPVSNPDFAGGPYPLDPRITLPAGGDYRDFSATDQPFQRTSDLTSLDLSFDVGFATLSSTSSYYKSRGSTLLDDTYSMGGLPSYLNYYAGNPVNPRFIRPQQFTDYGHTFTQELRLVSAAGPDKPVDYVVGLFYESQLREGEWNITDPGSEERSVLQGCTAPYYAGASFPNCLAVHGPNDLAFNQVDTQKFTDKSVFGEVTWHFTSHGQVTFGGRHFIQDFTDAQAYNDYTFPTFLPAAAHSSPASSNTFKVNPSYEYMAGQHVYATWSQGFRRGGANSVPLTGAFKESPELASYAPDKVNNYEVGLKGRFASGVTYSFAVFDIEWDNPQISASLPSGNLAVYNGKKARSQGFEFDSSGPLFLRDLTYNLGFAYAAAKLTESFALPANNGAGVITPGLVTGTAGQQLPGSPKSSVAATIVYDRSLVPGYDLAVSLNGTYRSTIPLGLSQSQGQSSAFGIGNLSATLTHRPWQGVLYLNNFTDKRAVLVAPVNLGRLDSLANDYTINRPREIGLRMSYSF